LNALTDSAELNVIRPRIFEISPLNSLFSGNLDAETSWNRTASSATQSLRCDFRLCENRRDSGGLVDGEAVEQAVASRRLHTEFVGVTVKVIDVLRDDFAFPAAFWPSGYPSRMLLFSLSWSSGIVE